MKLWTEGCALYIKREPTDRQFYKDESRLLNHIKKELNEKHGLDLIKKLAYKDGHLISETQHILRDRKGSFCIWDASYQIRNLATDFDLTSEGLEYITLTIECDDHENPPFSIPKEEQ